MSRRFRFWSRVFLPLALLGGLAGVGGIAFILSRYPWAMITNDYGNAQGLRFMAPWPMSPLQEELHARKKKRLPRSEMERVYQLDLRRMEYINIPIFDVFTNPSVRHGGFEASSRTLGFAEYPWPWLETARSLGDGTGPQKVSYVLLPEGRGMALTEGVLLAPGEELEFSFPLAKLKRYLRLSVMPLNTGTLKINIGPYAWARTFVDADVNKVQLISVPINDAAISQMKIVAASSRTFILGAQVTQSEMSGRMPIQVAEKSPLWSLNPAFARAPEPVGDVPAVDESKIDESVPAPSETPRPDESATPAPAATEASEAPESVATESREELDSLNLGGNQQILSPSGQTVALGYNFLVIHLDSIPAERFHDKKFMEKVAPRLSELQAESFVLDNGLRLPETDLRAYRHVVAGERLPRLIRDNPRLLRHELERRASFNLYRHLRNFGYHVVGVAPAPVVGVSSELAWTRDVPAFGSRWLDANDWNHARRRVKIDRDAQPLKGLEAVFAGKEQTLPAPMVTSDYTSIARFFETVSRDSRTFPDWQANEIFLPDERENYTATVIDYLQNWTAHNRQIRFFAHLWMSSEGAHDRPLVKDLARVAVSTKVSGLSEELVRGGIADVARLDRTVGQLLDVLKVRRLAHRTLLAVIIPDASGAKGERKARLLLKIPGVLPRSTGSVNMGLDDLVATLLSSVGVPLRTIPEDGGFSLPGRRLEEIIDPTQVQDVVASATPDPTPIAEATPAVPASEPVVPDLRSVSAFYVAIRPGPKGCAPVVWRASAPPFGLETSHPILEVDDSGRELTFFPCAIQSPLVTARWFQPMEPRIGESETLENRLRREAGGAFVVSKSDVASGLPRFFLGGKALRFTHPLLSMVNPSLDEVERVLLDVDAPEGMEPGMAYEKLRLASLSLDQSLDRADRQTSLLIWRTKTAR